VNPLGSTVFVLFFVVIGVFQKEEFWSECVCEIRFFDCCLFDPVWVGLVLVCWLVMCEPFGFDCFRFISCCYWCFSKRRVLE
jgi:hypothetical protein